MTQGPPTRDAPLHWGEARDMNAAEALMSRIEVDPRLRSTICALEILDCAPDWERFLAACEWATRMAPRFRQKVVEPALGVGSPRWVSDPDFDLHYHVRRIALPEGGGWSALLRAAEQVAMTPFDRARSPWESVPASCRVQERGSPRVTSGGPDDEPVCRRRLARGRASPAAVRWRGASARFARSSLDAGRAGIRGVVGAAPGVASRRRPRRRTTARPVLGPSS